MGGIGCASGKSAAVEAATRAIESPLLDSSIDNAKGVVFNISGGKNLSLSDVSNAARLIYDSVEENANVIFGALIDESFGDDISITVLATGFADNDLSNAIVEKEENPVISPPPPPVVRRKEKEAKVKVKSDVPDFLK